jgi:hypothetical protein
MARSDEDTFADLWGGRCGDNRSDALANGRGALGRHGTPLRHVFSVQPLCAVVRRLTSCGPWSSPLLLSDRADRVTVAGFVVVSLAATFLPDLQRRLISLPGAGPDALVGSNAHRGEQHAYSRCHAIAVVVETRSRIPCRLKSGWYRNRRYSRVFCDRREYSRTLQSYH